MYGVDGVQVVESTDGMEHMSEYTPTTADIRLHWIVSKSGPYAGGSANAREAFDRWLVAHDAEVKAEAEAEKRGAEWIASQAVIHRSEGDNRERNMREERDNLISVLNDKDDAPLWRRIARQRLELARLSRAQFQHSAEIRQLRRWFRERIASDGGQARKELRELRAEMDQFRAVGVRESEDT